MLGRFARVFHRRSEPKPEIAPAWLDRCTPREIREYLEDEGYPNSRISKGTVTLPIRAFWRCHVESVNLLLSHSEFDVDRKAADGTTLWFYIVTSQHHYGVRWAALSKLVPDPDPGKLPASYTRECHPEGHTAAELAESEHGIYFRELFAQYRRFCHLIRDAESAGPDLLKADYMGKAIKVAMDSVRDKEDSDPLLSEVSRVVARARCRTQILWPLVTRLVRICTRINWEGLNRDDNTTRDRLKSIARLLRFFVPLLEQKNRQRKNGVSYPEIYVNKEVIKPLLHEILRHIEGHLSFALSFAGTGGTPSLASAAAPGME